jgi:hypothetical protein
LKKLLILIQLFFLFGSFANDRAYFEQFIFKMENMSDDPDFPTYQYRYLMSDGQQKIRRADGKEIMTWVSLFLKSDGQYKIHYREHLLNNDGGFFPNGCKVIDGEWDVVNGELRIGDIAVGVKHFQDNQHHVMIKFTKSLITPEVVGVNNSYGYGFSNMSEDQAICFPF